MSNIEQSWQQHPTRHQLYGHLPPITKTIQVRRTRHAGNYLRSKDELISDVLLWTPAYGQAKAGWPARTYIQQLCEDTGCSPENLPEAMNKWEKWRERVRDIRASGTTWWWWWWYYLTLQQLQFLLMRLVDLYILLQKSLIKKYTVIGGFRNWGNCVCTISIINRWWSQLNDWCYTTLWIWFFSHIDVCCFELCFVMSMFILCFCVCLYIFGSRQESFNETTIKLIVITGLE